MTGNPSLDKIILGLNAVVVTGAAALVFFSHSMISKPATEREKEFGNMIENSINEYEKPTITMDEIVVNLYSRESRLRFLNTQMNIDIFNEEDRKLVLEMKPVIFDNLIDIAGNMKPAELNSVTGRILLETRLKNRINDYSNRPVLKKIFFSKYIIQ